MLSHTWGNTLVKVLTSQTLSEYSKWNQLSRYSTYFPECYCGGTEVKIRHLWNDCY
jgi:hypothetical protein